MAKPRRTAGAAQKPKPLGETVEQTARLNQLTDREKTLALAAKARKRLAFPAKLDEYQQVLDWCEQWEESVETVVRACFRIGFEHFQQFASNGAPYSPFAQHSITPRRPGQVDPSGRAFPPPPVRQSFERPGQFQPPPPRETVSETVEPVFGDADGMVQVGRKRVPAAGVLPSGATDNYGPAEPREPIPDELGAAIMHTIQQLQEQDETQVQTPTALVVRDDHEQMAREVIASEFAPQEPVPSNDHDPLAGGVPSASDVATSDEDISDLL